MENVGSHVTATIEVTVLRWTGHVTATLDGRERAVKQVRACMKTNLHVYLTVLYAQWNLQDVCLVRGAKTVEEFVCVRMEQSVITWLAHAHVLQAG